MSKTATLQDVARAAGVSTATVSRALSHPDMVSEATRQRVTKAAKVSGYRVNRAARNLRTQRAHSVLVLLPDLANPFFSTILEGISQNLARRGYSMLIASTQQVHDSGERLVDYLDDARADGMIILDGALDSDVVASLKTVSGSTRVLFACEWIEDGMFPSVRSENRRATKEAIRYLHEIGHRKIGHVTGPQGNVLTHARMDAFKDAVSELELQHHPHWVIEGGFSLESGCEAAQSWIAMENRPTAVFCVSDMVAMGFISELSRNGFTVPGNVSVMGFDDIDLAEQFIPPLTSMRQDRLLLGKTAALMLLDRIENGESASLDHAAVIPVSLIVRASTAVPPHKAN